MAMVRAKSILNPQVSFHATGPMAGNREALPLFLKVIFTFSPVLTLMLAGLKLNSLPLTLISVIEDIGVWVVGGVSAIMLPPCFDKLIDIFGPGRF